MKLFTLLFLILALVFAPGALKAQDEPTADRKPYIQQQMILMGLYVYGIQQELAKVRPDSDELFFLSDSILAIAEEIDKTKLAPNQHENLDGLLKAVKDLRRYSMTRPDKAKKLAQDLINSCGNCHASEIKGWKVAR